MPTIVCRPKLLSLAQEEIAIRRAIQINPANAEGTRTVARTPAGRRGGPRRLALLVGNRWPKAGVDLSVRFLDRESKQLRRQILLHMNAWSESANVRFRETNGTGLVRIARLTQPAELAGYWSYIGTQILGVPEDQPTLNLEGFTLKTPDEEFRRVVRHEAGHTLGFEHEHLRAELVKKIDRKKAVAYFDLNQGWTEAETEQQVLTPLSAASIMGSAESDPVSIMCYQIPGDITKDGKPIPGGTDINPKDFAFAAQVYPKADSGPPKPPPLKQAKPPTEAAADSTDSHPAAEGPAAPPQDFQTPEADTFRILILDEFDPEPRKPATKPETRSAPNENAAGKRQKYARVLASYGGAQVSSTMRLRADKGEPRTTFGDIIAMHERLKKYTNREEGSPPSDAQLVKFGSDLFETLFPGDVRLLYHQACARQHHRKLDVVLTSMIPWIAEKPWEFAYDAKSRSFLATENVHLVRNVVSTVPADFVPPQSGPLQILVVAAQPVGLLPLSVEHEIEVIRRGFEPLIDAGLAGVEVIARATPGRVHSRLSTRKFSVVHFVGHSLFDERAERGVLLFEDDHGGKNSLAERSVREIFCKRGVKLVFLNSCESGSGGRAKPNAGIAQSMVEHGLPALVANQYSVRDQSATSFAQHFYWALAQGMSIGRAACEARIAVNYALRGEIIDWAVPVVFTRDPNLTLCTRPEQPKAAPFTGMRQASRRAIETRAVRVAVWDIDNSFPALRDTLEQMNRAQSVFGFELVAFSAPLDAWDLDHRARDGSPYLWAEKLAGRLGKMPAELQVDVLVCVTRQWLRNNPTFNLYGWWPDRQNPPVVIFSCAGFPALAPAGPETNRVIANVTVELLAGFLGDLDSHKDGARDCPLAFNQARDLAILAGVQQFDKPCRDKLKKLPKELPALEALLKAFH